MTRRKKIFLLPLILLSILVVSVSGCTIDDFPDINQLFFPSPTAAMEPTRGITQTPTNVPTLLVEDEVGQDFIIWIPPELDPKSGSKAGSLLLDQLNKFSEQNQGMNIILRIKEKVGTASLINSLEATSSAAPRGLPSLIAMRRADLETAALKGLIYPVDDEDEIIKDPDLYSYAQDLCMIRGTLFGIPFAGDALVITYRASIIQEPPADWDSIFTQGQPLAFPAGDPQALFPISLYLSNGGLIMDDLNRPMIEQDPVLEVFELISEGARLGILPSNLNLLISDEQSWQVYQEQGYQWVITWISNYLGEMPADSLADLVPSLGEDNYSLADGWVWVISDNSPERRELAAEMALFLTEREFLNQWTVAAGFLPVRPSGIGEWTNRDTQDLILSVISTMNILPQNDILSTVGPIFQEKTTFLIRREMNALEAAQSILQRFNNPD